MAQRAGRVGVNPADVNPVTGHVNVEVPGNVYTKTQVDNKFLTKTKAASDYQAKNLAVPIQLLDGTALTVETALQGINSQKQDKELAVPIQLLDGTALTVENALQGINSEVNEAVSDISDISERVASTPYSYVVRHTGNTTKTYLLSFESDFPLLFFASTFGAQACSVTTKSGTSPAEPFVIPLNYTGANEIFTDPVQVSRSSFKITIGTYRNVFILSDTKFTITEVIEP